MVAGAMQVTQRETELYLPRWQRLFRQRPLRQCPLRQRLIHLLSVTAAANTLMLLKQTMLQDLPIRRSSRLIIVSPQDRLLLFRYDDEHSDEFWATVGGELQGDESYRDAAERELFEETGYRVKVGEMLRTRDAVYAVALSTTARWLEQYFLVRVESEAIPSSLNWTDEERSTITACRWWSVEEMKQLELDLKPDWIGSLLQEVISSNS